ncbi:hypothetical protein H0H81_012205 [Sphagnurus paluster]|uniref:Nucleolar pre-ribosomal-associated protein 1 n=1 Tax=Sphagnurus paluster TaxID=117069 RepID=A0A9P7FNC3_9AGAR|nr:hypothetical protein H0H81_012205 [Sphagnurus paluster]
MHSSSKRFSAPPAKRQKLEQKQVFTSAEDISAALRVQNQDLLFKNLTALRSQLSLKPGEETVSPQDERLLLAQHWLEKFPGAHDIFGIWDSLVQRQSSVFALIVSILSSLLALTSSHYTFQALGQPILKTLLTPTIIRRLNSYIGGTHAELILVTLKLYNTMSLFARGRERKSLLEAFGWEVKSLPKLLNMRRKSKTEEASDALVKPDIRTLYILFLLSFINPDTPIQVKTMFLEQHREPFLAIFKGLIQDSYSVVRKILEVCWAGVWSDPKLKRTLKIGLFNESTLSHLSKVYDRNVAEDGEPEHVPADLLHHFMLAICTRPGTGICFRDRGWYPRDTDGESNDDSPGRGKIYNKILSNILKGLKVNEDPRQQELGLKIMSACAELVSGYWTAAALTLEPRLSSKWIANIAFFGSVISLPVPLSSFYLPDTTLYQPAPPPLSHIIENILPSVNTKAHFSKGLQSTSGLVQHCTAIALSKCLAKFEEVIAIFRAIETALEENEADGQWCKRRRDIEREARRRVPDFQVIVAFSQQKFGEPATTAGAPPTRPNPIRAALLAESAQRLLWMYHRCLPLVVAEARFDVGKLLQTFSTEAQVARKGDEPLLSAASRLYAIRQLHILRLLKDSDQFSWSGKMGSTSQSYLAVLLQAFLSSEIAATRRALSLLLRHILSESILFQEDPREINLWLISLPAYQRGHGTESPDGASLNSEADSIITFLDDCVQRCLKSPHRYIEDLHSLASAESVPSSVDKFDVLPSPLLMTVLEQLEIKVTKKSLSPSDILALASFFRKLVFRLSTKQQDLTFLHAIVAKFDTMLHINCLFSQYPAISVAIRREVELLNVSLSPVPSPLPEVSEDVKDFLSNIVNDMPIPVSDVARKSTAFELVDWLRLIEGILEAEEIRKVGVIFGKLYPPALSFISQYTFPAEGALWRGLDLSSRFDELRELFDFDFLFLHAAEAQVVDQSCRRILAETALGREPNLADARRAVFLISHRLSARSDTQTAGLFLLLADILRRSSNKLPADDVAALKEDVFGRSVTIKSRLVSNSLANTVQEALYRLVEETLDPANISDRMLIADTRAHWLEVLNSSLEDDSIQANTLLMNLGMPNPSTLGLLIDILTALKYLVVSQPEAEVELIQRLPRLMALRSALSDSIVLEELIATAIESSTPAYFDGHQCGQVLEEMSLVDVMQSSDLRWSRHSHAWPGDLPAQSFLTKDVWSSSTVAIVSGLIYKGSLVPNDIITWLATDHCACRSSEHFAATLNAFLDACSCRREELADHDVWYPQFRRLVQIILEDGTRKETRLTAVNSILLMVQLIPSRVSQFLASLSQIVQSLPVTKLIPQFLCIGRHLHASLSAAAEPFITELVDHAIQWAVRFFAEPEDASFDVPIEDLVYLVKCASGIKPHLVETIMGVAIQNRLAHLPALGLVTALLSNVHLKPVVVNRHLQSILQHPHFFKYCSGSAPIGARDAIIRLIHTLFHMHPTNTCQPSHVEPLVCIYRGTLSPADGHILSIFQLFETERKVSIASLLNTWSSTPNIRSGNSLEALRSLDAILVLRTCLNFPRWRRLENLSTENATPHEAQLYDPVFLMLLFAQALAESPPESAFTWVELFRTNIVSLLIKALSSKDPGIRDTAMCQIAALWQYLETADLQERPHVIHILHLLKDILPSPTDELPRRLPSYTSLLLLHALRAIFYPSNFIYPITARFLLQRPELDTDDVPMLYNMLYSSSDDWKKERGWMIRFLSDGMMSTEAWRILKGRHTWELLASIFQSSEEDRALRSGVLEVLANLTCNTQATTSLILKSGLLSWIEVQLLTSNTNGIEWVKILNNIMTIVSAEKLESSTNGEWRAAIVRCLVILLDSSKSGKSVPTQTIS